MSEKKIPQDVYKRIELDALAWSENQHGHDDVNTDYLNGALREAAIAQEQISALQIEHDHLKTKYDNILATEDGHSSQTENVWQSGYAAGHETGYERGKREGKGAVWVKASEFAYVAGDPYHAKDNKSKGAGCFDAAGNFTWGDGSVTPHHAQDDLLILDESPAEQPVVSQDAHEKEVMMQAFDKVRQIFEGREWIMEGRGSYPYNDDRYKEEVRYMYDEFDTLQKDTWKNIQSKSFEYRKAIIAEYQAEQPVREAEAVTFTDWVKHNTKGYDPIVEKWVYGENEYRYTTTELYNLFKGRPAEWSGEKEKP